MVKASLTLPNGTSVQVEGSTEEVRELLAFYGGGHATGAGESSGKEVHRRTPRTGSSRHAKSGAGRQAQETGDNVPELVKIVAFVKDCDEAEGIEKRILDRISQVDRVLLPLYIVHEHLGNGCGLTSGEITKITKELGVPVLNSNVSHTLAGSAARYVIADQVRKKGQSTRYKLSRRGVVYLKAVIAGKQNENAK